MTVKLSVPLWEVPELSSLNSYYSGQVEDFVYKLSLHDILVLQDLWQGTEDTEFGVLHNYYHITYTELCVAFHRVNSFCILEKEIF